MRSESATAVLCHPPGIKALNKPAIFFALRFEPSTSSYEVITQLCLNFLMDAAFLAPIPALRCNGWKRSKYAGRARFVFGAKGCEQTRTRIKVATTLKQLLFF